MTTIKRSGNAEWSGDLRSGKGVISTESQVLKDEKYGFHTRFEDKPGTNPEELIAAAHAMCFSMAFAMTLANEGYPPEHLATSATCFLESQEMGSFAITKMRLDVRGWVPNIDVATFEKLAHVTDKGCPVSNLLRSGLTIEVTTTLM